MVCWFCSKMYSRRSKGCQSDWLPTIQRHAQ